MFESRDRAFTSDGGSVVTSVSSCALSVGLMFRLSVHTTKAVVAFAKDGKKPQMPAGKSFINTGVTLITDDAAAGVPSKDTKFGLANCWG